MPDALSKTIPIWCCVMNRAIFPDLGPHPLHTPPQAVSPSEHSQIEKRIDGFVQQFRVSSSRFNPYSRMSNFLHNLGYFGNLLEIIYFLILESNFFLYFVLLNLKSSPHSGSLLCLTLRHIRLYFLSCCSILIAPRRHTHPHWTTLERNFRSLSVRFGSPKNQHCLPFLQISPTSILSSCVLHHAVCVAGKGPRVAISKVQQMITKLGQMV